LIRQKKKVKGIFLACILVILILFSNIAPYTGYNSIMNENNSSVPFNEERDEQPKTSAANLTTYITGEGVNQTVKLYMSNISKSLDNQDGNFEIPAPADNMYLDYGDFRFEFGNNYTTEYIIEEDSALNPRSNYFEEYNFVRDDSYALIEEGIGASGGGIDDLIPGYSTFWNVSSSPNGIVNLTICANFSNAIQLIDGNDLPFNRSNIAGFNLDFEFKLNRSANVTIYMKWRNITSRIWRNITNTIEYNYTQGPHRIEELIINENLGFINESDCVIFQFLFDRSSEIEKNFNVTLYEFALDAFVLLELPIASNSWVALEFDLRGNNSTVNGFYAWIRTLDLDRAQYGHLNISLYRANSTMKTTGPTGIANLGRVNLLIEPNLTQLIDSIILEFDDYSGDNYTYFEFDKSKTDNLNRYNYYIVVTSNVSSGVYSLVTLPSRIWDYGDTDDYFWSSADPFYWLLQYGYRLWPDKR